MKYNLGVLNDVEFEALCKDLLELELGLNLQIFKSGKDGGIDLLYSDKKENELVIQVKHYELSGYAQLKQTLVKHELNSIGKMDPIPTRYLLATSVPFSPQQSREIKTLMTPHILSTNDIYGRRRIESLISKHTSVETKYFKLWLTSTNVLQQILNNATVNNSEFFKERIISRAKLYVPNPNFDQALQKLNDHKFLIISGAPGVGKSTLAYMLVYERLAAGFELIFGDGKIVEIEGLLSKDPEKKQIFMLDDFLGANLYDIRNQKNPESKILSFITKVQHSTNKYLVLTSRTTILNQANHCYESLNRSNLTELSKYELKLTEYSLLDKAKILYNHLYFSKLHTNFHDTFYKKENYVKILNHPNYFPRTIEFITDESRYSAEKYGTVEQFIFHKLDKPEQIWAFAFEEQLEDEDRFLIMSLFSLGGTAVQEDILEEAFDSRYTYEIKHNNKERKPRAFTNSLKKLLDGFLRASQDVSTGVNSYSFLNPSIADFLLYYLKNDNDEKNRLLMSIAFTEQITGPFDINGENKVIMGKKFQTQFFPRFLELSEDLKTSKSEVSVHLEVLEILMFYFSEQISQREDVIIKWIKKILDDPSDINSLNLSLIFVNISIDELKEAINLIENNWNLLIKLIIDQAKSSDDLGYLVELFRTYNQNFQTYLDTDDFRSALENKLKEIFEDIAEDIEHDESYIAELVDHFGHKHAVEKIENDVWEKYCEFINDINLDEYFDIFNHSYEIDASEIITNSLDYLHNSYKEIRTKYNQSNHSPPIDPWIEIDRLFKKT